MHEQGIRFRHLQTYDQATVYHFYLKIYLETGAPPLCELPGSEGALSFLSVTSDSHVSLCSEHSTHSPVQSTQVCVTVILGL